MLQVRRQFLEHPGIMTYAEKPEYARCVSIVAASALREMIKPGLLAVGAPVVVGERLNPHMLICLWAEQLLRCSSRHAPHQL